MPDHQRISRSIIARDVPAAWSHLPVPQIMLTLQFNVSSSVVWLDEFRMDTPIDPAKIPNGIGLTPEDTRRCMLLGNELTKRAFCQLAFLFRELTELYQAPVVVPVHQFGAMKSWMINFLNRIGFERRNTQTMGGYTVDGVATLLHMKLPKDVSVGSVYYYEMYEEELKRIRTALYEEQPYFPTEEDIRWQNFDKQFLESIKPVTRNRTDEENRLYATWDRERSALISASGTRTQKDLRARFQQLKNTKHGTYPTFVTAEEAEKFVEEYEKKFDQLLRERKGEDELEKKFNQLLRNLKRQGD